MFHALEQNNKKQNEIIKYNPFTFVYLKILMYMKITILLRDLPLHLYKSYTVCLIMVLMVYLMSTITTVNLLDM